MSLPVRVLGARVLVRPDVDANAPTQTAAGVYVAASLAAAITGEDKTTNFSRGTVVAVGNPQHPLKDEAESLAEKLMLSALYAAAGRVIVRRAVKPHAEDLSADAAALLRDLVRRKPCVSVDDDVLFSHDAGQQITIEAETYVILHEDELLAVVTEEGAL